MPVHTGSTQRGAAARARFSRATSDLHEVAELLVERRLSLGDDATCLAEDFDDCGVEPVDGFDRERAHHRLWVHARFEEHFVGVGVAHRVERRLVHQEHFGLIAPRAGERTEHFTRERGRIEDVDADAREARHARDVGGRGDVHFAHLNVVAIAKLAAVVELERDGEIGGSLRADRAQHETTCEHGRDDEIDLCAWALEAEQDEVSAARDAADRATDRGARQALRGP